MGKAITRVVRDLNYSNTGVRVGVDGQTPNKRTLLNWGRVILCM